MAARAARLSDEDQVAFDDVGGADGSPASGQAVSLPGWPQRHAIAPGKFDPAGELELHQRDAHLPRRGFRRTGEVVERDRRGTEQGDDAVAGHLSRSTAT